MTRTLLTASIMLVSASLTFAVFLGIAALSSAQAQIYVSGDVTSVPRSPIVKLSTLSPATVRTSADQALRTALSLKEFGLSYGQIDPSVGVVRAMVDVPGDPLKHDIKAWIVTADVQIAHSIFGHRVLYHALCIIVNATSGRYEFAYAANPVPIEGGAG